MKKYLFVAVFKSTILQEHQLGYENRIRISEPLMTFKQNEIVQYGLDVTKIVQLINGLGYLQ